jgi:hypothetical protein
MRRRWSSLRASVVHAWYSRPGLLMIGFVVLSAAATGIAETASWSGQWSPVLLPAVVVLALLTSTGWRICRICRMLLLVLSWSGVIGAVLHIAPWWDVQAFAVLAIEAVMIALLLSPAVYLRTRIPDRIFGKPDGVPLRLLGKRWRLAVFAAPVFGLALTLAWLGHPTPLHGTFGHGGGLAGAYDPQGPFGRGFPLPVDHGLIETADRGTGAWHLHGALITNWASFGRDYVQWTFASLVLLAVLWLWWQRRPSLPAAPTQVTGSQISATGLAPR